MRKKIAAVMAVVLILFNLTACSGESKPALTAEEISVSPGVYAYYFDKAIEKTELSDADGESLQAARQAAKEACLDYMGAIKLMEKKGITLSNELKREAAQNTEDIWSLFSEYYESIGVTKQDITKIQTHECRKLRILDYYFGAEGIAPVSEMDLKEEFVDIYVGFKAITGVLTKENDKGETVSLSDSEEQEIETLFKSMASRLNAGTATIDELNEEYNNSLDIIVTGNLTTELMKEGDPMYDDGFFKEVMSISHGKAGVVKSGTYIYVVQRQTIATADEDAFALYRSEVLESMKMPAIEKKIKNNADKLTVVENSRVLEKTEKIVIDAQKAS